MSATATLERFEPGQRAYQPFGAAYEVFRAREPEVLVAGAAGTGKSRAILEKLHLIAEKYPNSRILILRKTRASLSQSGLVTFEKFVVPEGHPILMRGTSREMRQTYRYPNGSEVVVGGLDKSEKVMSTEYDIAYIQEAIEVGPKDWENVTTRLRNGVLPYQQLIADTNPDAPTHWLYQRCLEGKCRLIESKHEDNPLLFDQKQDQPVITQFGIDYLRRLDNLTGARYQRLRKGLWVGAEGQVYDEWDPYIHVIQRKRMSRDWPCIWTIDFGYVNPFVWQQWIIDPDDRMFLHREIYKTKLLVEDAVPMMLYAADGRVPMAVICDHDAEDRATLHRHLKIQTKSAYKAVGPGIQGVSLRIRKADDDKPRIFIMENSLIHEPDPDLRELKKPTCTAEEVPNYVWDLTAGQKRGDQVVKEDDHGCDAMRYGVCWKDKVGGGGTRIITASAEDIEHLEMLKSAEQMFYGYRNAAKRQNGRYRQ